jgi:uncharacterized membrane protein (UPF0182 family)
MVYEHKRAPRRRWPWVILGVLLLLVLLLPTLGGTLTDWLWYRELGRGDVYWTLFWGRWLLGAGAAIGFFALMLANLLIAFRLTPDEGWYDFSRRVSEQMSVSSPVRLVRRIVLWSSITLTGIIALLVGNAVANTWPRFLLFTQAAPIDQRDPIFGLDISFYLFRLPIWTQVNTLVFSALLLALGLVAVVYLFIRSQRGRSSASPFSTPALVHLSILLALVLASKAVGYFLGRFEMITQRTSDFVGPGYADIHARIPGLAIMGVLALAAAVLVLANIRLQRLRVLGIAIGGLIAASFLILGVYPGLVQRFKVEPNELELEKPFIAHNIALTRKAYGLDQITTRQFTPRQRVTTETLNASPTTEANIRLWDYRPLHDVYKQRQELRPYYSIHDVDVDRYQLNGQMRQVMVSARELDVAQLPEQTWVNRHILYTHGYGMVMSPVNAFDPDKGEPLFFVSDIPPRSTDASLKITRPGIYFGELTDDYVLVGSSRPEFDYPRDDAEGSTGNARTTYNGKAGISLKHPFTRLLLAQQFNALNLVISDYITPKSRILFRRNIIERASAVAPFLTFDADPYLVVGTDGHLYWLLDGYTRSSRYPYATYSTLQVAGNRQVEQNYLRNPVKMVIDAYDGTVDLYRTDDTDPIIAAWGRIFPKLFKPLAEMPAGLHAHVRTPEGQFNTISTVYQRYHMTDPTVFYQQEDRWAIPSETVAAQYGQDANVPMQAYYIVMNLPGSTEPEYLLIRPYTPVGKRNMIAWLSARSDADRLGELLVYNFPKQSLVNGPEQIQASINQSPEISEAFTLWGTAGSRVWKGNLMVIPIGDTVLYVQSIFLQAEQSQIPELQRVIVADQDRVVMRRTLEEALAVLTGRQGGRPVVTAPAPTPGRATPPPATAAPPEATAQQRALARSAYEHYQRAQDAMKRGDWETYGKEIEQVGRDLEQLRREAP